MNYWLMKSEPSTFGIDHLARAKNRTTGWDGVRNFQARNFIRTMKKGDLAFFYHSSCDVPGIAGVVSIEREAYPDPTAFDATARSLRSRQRPREPRWYMVDVKLQRKFGEVMTLEKLQVARLEQAEEHDRAEARQSTLDHAGDEERMGLHQLARRVVSASARAAKASLAA